MKGFFSKLRKNKKGYTLTELIVVVAILGVLAVIAVPIIMNSVRDARLNADETSAKAIETAIQMCLADATLVYGDHDNDNGTLTKDRIYIPSGTSGGVDIDTIIKNRLVGREYPENITGTMPSGVTHRRVWYLHLETGKVAKDATATTTTIEQLN